MKFPCIKMSQCFPEPYQPFGGDINVNKSRLKNATEIDTCKLALKSDLANLKAEADK